MRGRLPSGRAVTVQIADGVVAGIEDAPDDADLPWLLPGLLDLQVNGYDGLDVNADPPGPAVVHDLTRALWRHGITGWCPTIITAGRADMLARIRAVAEAVASDETTRHGVAGIHVEGPHLSPQDGARGVHEARHVRPPDVAELETWVDAAAGLLAIVTLSPEWDGTEDYVRACRARGVVAAIGHTAATPEQVRRCVDAGATLSTHLGNGAPATIPRHPNAIWAQLAADTLSASFIADGHHLPADTLTAMIRAKTVPRSVLISDSTALAGRPPGDYDTPVGGRVTLSADGRLAPVGSPYLAGSAITLADALGRVVDLARVSLADAVRMATANPAGVLGARGHGHGRVEPGAPADLFTCDWSPGDRGLRVREVVVAGRTVWSKAP
jgi:N-acetylglucosamine-6-phosphate deacetylase